MIVSFSFNKIEGKTKNSPSSLSKKKNAQKTRSVKYMRAMHTRVEIGIAAKVTGGSILLPSVT